LPTFSVSGKVALKPGQKLPPYLRIIPSGLISAPVRPDGSFVATGLQAGTYWFGTGLVPKPPDFVVVDKDITGLSVALPLTGLLTGSIETTARPLNEPISLWLVDAANPASRVGVSSARSFELDLPEGEYRVAADGIPDGYRIDSVTVDGASVQSGFFKMAPDSRMRLVITVSEKPGSASSSPAAPALRQVFGRVERQGANATGVVGLRFSDASGPRATVLFDMSLADPTFLLALPAGEYKVEAMLPATGNQLTLRIKSATYRSLDILSMPLRITEESAGEIRVVIETLQ
jgi:hypothetical protein